MRARVALAGATLAISACRTQETWVRPDPHLERMLTQEKVLAYGDAKRLPHEMAMQHPPEGTRPVGVGPEDPVTESGVLNGRYVTQIPVFVDHTILEEARGHFDTFCATCHGALGDGDSIVATKMMLRTPPSLHLARLREAPAGQLFDVVRRGYGLMPSYSVELSVDATWGLVAYVRALQIARGVRVADLPSDVRADVAREDP